MATPSKRGVFDGSCWECSEAGHQARNCPKRRKRKGRGGGQPLRCFSCGQLGHFIKDCSISKQKKSQDESDKKSHQSVREKSLEHTSSINTHSIKDNIAPSLDDTKSITAPSLDDSKSITAPSLDDTKSIIAPSLDDTQSITAPSLDDTKSITTPSLDDPSNDDIIMTHLPLYDDDLFASHKGPTGSKPKGRKDTLLYERIATCPNYLDTHCHVEYLLERHRLSSFSALKSKFSYPPNFDGCITSFCDSLSFSSFSCAHELLEEKGIWASFGVHPHHSYIFNSRLEDKLVQWLTHPKCVALGEVGLDYSSHSLKNSTILQQKEVFHRMLTLAQAFTKPLVIHCRDAENDLYDILTEYLPVEWFVHLHCYTGSVEMADKFLAKFPNLYLGLTGHVTFYKFEHSRQIATNVPLNRILIETDSPYMVPYTMKRTSKWSHPPMSACVAQEIATLRHCSIDHVLCTTRESAKKMYGI